MSSRQVGRAQLEPTTTVSPQFVSCGVTSVCDVEEHDEAGARKPAKVLNPQLPSKEEVEEHNMTHLPFRSWCQHCVKG